MGGAGATLSATIDANGRVDTVSVNAVGGGYSTSPALSPASSGSLKSIPTTQISDSCTLNYTADANGALTSVSLASPGRGYPADSVIRLTVIDNGNGAGEYRYGTRVGFPGKDGTVTATTNSNGIVTNVTLDTVGSGYPFGDSGVPTLYSPPTWVLDKIGGKYPDHRNPQHFIKYTNPDGSDITEAIPLDGHGSPAYAPLIYKGYILRLPGDPVINTIQYYPGNNLFLLGVPATL